MHAYDTFQFTHAGREFIASIYQDDDSTPPWARGDCHGAVSGWTTRDKKPGEVVISKDRSSKRFYDVQSAIATAKKDGWGVSEKDRATLTKNLGREPTTREIRKAAVQADFEYLRSWCNDDWQYCGVAVRLLGEDGGPVGEEFDYALWGVESHVDDYIKEVAHELASEAPDNLPAIAAAKTLLAALLHAALTGETLRVGREEFSPGEVVKAIAALAAIKG